MKIDFSLFDADDDTLLKAKRQQAAQGCAIKFAQLTGAVVTKDDNPYLIWYTSASPMDHLMKETGLLAREVPKLGLVHSTQSRHHLEYIEVPSDLTNLDTRDWVMWAELFRMACRTLGLSCSTYDMLMKNEIVISRSDDFVSSPDREMRFTKHDDPSYVNAIHKMVYMLVWILERPTLQAEETQ